MKKFEPIKLDLVKAARELKDFERLLKANASLDERREIKPFFRDRLHLSALIGLIDSRVDAPDCYASELQIKADFYADLVIGSKSSHRPAYCMVELESGHPNSVFKKHARKSTPDWSPCFDHGFSQLVDWCCALDDWKSSGDFEDLFGDRYATFSGLLVIGRSAGLEKGGLHRLIWRDAKVIVGSSPIYCLTYDQLCDRLLAKLRLYSAAPTAG